MRAAPAGLIGGEDAFRLGCELAAITHGHPSGYLAAGFLAATVASLVDGVGLPAAVASARETLCQWPRHEECLRAVDLAVMLAGSAPATAETVAQLGEGWVAEEALAIALFCSLRATSFGDGVILAVNHSGDSDSTGAISGNILGALLGKEAIPTGWVEPLELRGLIDELADDLIR